MMKTYHKIETLFVRDTITNKLIEGQFRNPMVEQLKDLQWVFTEKIDGTNIRVVWDGHTVMFGGRTDNAQIPTSLLNDVLYPKFAGTIKEQMFEQKFGEKEVILIGEGCGAGIQKGGELYGEKRKFVLFDVLVNDKFLDRADVEDVANYFQVDVVPIVFVGTIEQGVDFVKAKQLCKYAEKEKIAEGVVGRPKVEMYDKSGNRAIVKIKYEDFNDN